MEVVCNICDTVMEEISDGVWRCPDCGNQAWRFDGDPEDAIYYEHTEDFRYDNFVLGGD